MELKSKIKRKLKTVNPEICSIVKSKFGFTVFCCREKVVELFDADMPSFLWLPAGKSYRRSQQLQIR